jgi:branched-chain amino acid transport system ATP-binding protein
MTCLLSMRELSISFGGIAAVQNVSIDIPKGQIYSIIGPNGAGKTTLFNIVSGVYAPDNGSVLLDGRDITALPPDRLSRLGMSRTFQNLQIFFRMSAIENVMVGCHRHEKTSIVSQMLGLPSVNAENRNSERRAREFISFVGLDRYADHSAGAMPYGALKRLEIARSLATEPSILLLDEPAAGCNPTETEEVEQVIRKIADRGITVLLVEHDMKLVMRISNRIVVLDRGKQIFEGNAKGVQSDPHVIAAYLGAHGAREAASA